MKPKSKISKDQLLADGTVYYGFDSKGNEWSHGKIVKPAADVKPTEPKAADVVVRPEPKLNAAPRITDAPRRKLPEATGLQRAINANIAARGGHIVTAPEKTDDVTGLQRAINANVVAAKAKKS